MNVKITPNEKGNPPGKLADAELHFTDGPLEGLKLIGFSIWEKRGGGGRNVTFPPDAVDEVSVATAGYAAEYGNSGGGVERYVLKSGTNQWRGSLYEYLRNEAFDSQGFFDAVTPVHREHEWGGTFGGPIVLNRTHFFVAAERSDENQFFTVNTGARFPQYDGTYESEQYRWTYSVRVDHQLSQTQNLFGRVAQEIEYRPIITSGGRNPKIGIITEGMQRETAAAR